MTRVRKKMSRTSGRITRPADRGAGIYGINMLQRNDSIDSMLDNPVSSVNNNRTNTREGDLIQWYFLSN